MNAEIDPTSTVEAIAKFGCRCRCDGWCEQCSSRPCAGADHLAPKAPFRRR